MNTARTHRAQAGLMTRVALTGFAAASAVLIGLAVDGALGRLEPLLAIVVAGA